MTEWTQLSNKHRRKLPKQWKHWIKKAGLRLERPGRSKFSVFYFEGRNRRFRVTTRGEFQASFTKSEFDRWALSVEFTSGIPTTEKQFLTLVKNVNSDFWRSR